jgi:hypothetical protein
VKATEAIIYTSESHKLARADEVVPYRDDIAEGRLQGEVLTYFSPATKGVAKSFDAQPCEKPSRAGLGLLAGDKLSRSILSMKNILQQYGYR